MGKPKKVKKKFNYSKDRRKEWKKTKKLPKIGWYGYNSIIPKNIPLSLANLATIYAITSGRRHFFFGVRIRLGAILDRFSIIYFRGLGLRIWVGFVVGIGR